MLKKALNYHKNQGFRTKKKCYKYHKKNKTILAK